MEATGMSATAYFFVLMGVTSLVTGLMRVVEYLDTPHETVRQRRRPAVRASEKALDRTVAELELERARLAA